MVSEFSLNYFKILCISAGKTPFLRFTTKFKKNSEEKIILRKFKEKTKFGKNMPVQNYR